MHTKPGNVTLKTVDYKRKLNAESKGVTAKVEKRLLSDIPAITEKGPTVSTYEIYSLWYVLHEDVAWWNKFFSKSLI